jgi:hypothetical protein
MAAPLVVFKNLLKIRTTAGALKSGSWQKVKNQLQKYFRAEGEAYC